MSIAEWCHERTADTYTIDIYIAGSPEIAKQVCDDYCWAEHFCVNVQEVDYIYTGGNESGVKIGIIQYPRFPKEINVLENRAFDIGYKVAEACNQWSFTIVSSGKTRFYSRREEE
jgi:hypothetical protein